MITPAVPDPPELDDVLWRGFEIGDVAYDVGANCGQTVDIIHGFNERVVAFEPAEEAYQYLDQLILPSRSSWLTISPLAVSDTREDIELVAAPSKIATGQLVTHGTEGMEWSEEEMRDGEIRVLRATTLDHFSREYGVPDFIKIDVEGHEGAVLRGAAQLIREYQPQMLIEVHSELLGTEIAAQLGATHYLDLVRHPHYVPGSLLWRTHFWYRAFPKA